MMAVIIVNQANLQICEIIFRYLYRIGAALPPHMGHARLVVGQPSEVVGWFNKFKT